VTARDCRSCLRTILLRPADVSNSACSTRRAEEYFGPAVLVVVILVKTLLWQGARYLSDLACITVVAAKNGSMTNTPLLGCTWHA